MLLPPLKSALTRTEKALLLAGDGVYGFAAASAHGCGFYWRGVFFYLDVVPAAVGCYRVQALTEKACNVSVAITLASQIPYRLFLCFCHRRILHRCSVGERQN